MHDSSLRVSSILCGGCLMLGASIPAWATSSCQPPMPTDWNGRPLPEGASWFTPYSGSVGNCPIGQNGCSISFGGGSGYNTRACSFHSTDAQDETILVTIEATAASGAASWTASCTKNHSPVSCVGVALVDSVRASTGGQSGNGCFYGFDVDAAAGQAGKVPSLNRLTLCSDGIYEPIPAPIREPAVVQGCYLQSGQTAVIHGVEVSCPAVPNGEQRTIIVAKDTETDLQGDLTRPQGFGFTNTSGIIDFNNICICVGGSVDEIEEMECNPNPEVYTDPALDGLPECTISADSQPPVELSIQNPYCVTVGGGRRCY
jgi:hypothetical protein